MVLFRLEVRTDHIYAMEAWRDFCVLDVHPLYSCTFLCMLENAAVTCRPLHGVGSLNIAL